MLSVAFLPAAPLLVTCLWTPLLSGIEAIELNDILALQLLDAAASNKIALQNILIITAAVDFKEKEGNPLAYLADPF